jgi:hypothetical protein
LCDGTIVLTNMSSLRGLGGLQEYSLEFTDTSSFMFPKTSPVQPHGVTTNTTNPTAMTTTNTTTTAATAATPKALTDLGILEQPVIGFRDFVLRTSIDGPILMSRNDHPWPYRKRMRALCAAANHGQPFSKHDAPRVDCNCGIYAYARPDDKALQQTDVVWGEIAMWGEVLICETGYRAQFAYPLNLFMRDNGTKNIHYLAEELQDLYGVPCFVVAEREGKTAQEIMSEMIEEMLRPVKEGE